MFTLEIGGKPVAMIQATKTQALAFLEAEFFKRDMQRWLTNGKPIGMARQSSTSARHPRKRLRISKARTPIHLTARARTTPWWFC